MPETDGLGTEGNQIKALDATSQDEALYPNREHNQQAEEQEYQLRKDRLWLSDNDNESYEEAAIFYESKRAIEMCLLQNNVLLSSDSIIQSKVPLRA